MHAIASGKVRPAYPLAPNGVPWHRIIWRAGWGRMSPGGIIHHINGDKNDYRLANLIWIPRFLHPALLHTFTYEDMVAVLLARGYCVKDGRAVPIEDDNVTSVAGASCPPAADAVRLPLAGAGKPAVAGKIAPGWAVTKESSESRFADLFDDPEVIARLMAKIGLAGITKLPGDMNFGAFFAGVAHGREPTGDPERAAWLVRWLYETGIVTLDLPEIAGEIDDDIGANLQLLAACRWFAFPGTPFPLSKHFVIAWFRLSARAAQELPAKLEVAKTIEKIGTIPGSGRRMRLFRLANVPLPANWQPPKGFRPADSQPKPKRQKPRASLFDGRRLPDEERDRMRRCLATWRRRPPSKDDLLSTAQEFAALVPGLVEGVTTDETNVPLTGGANYVATLMRDALDSDIKARRRSGR